MPKLDGPITERVHVAVDVWRRRLLDLSRRNRALNFKPTKVSTVTIVDERPAEVYRHLCIEGRSMRFAPVLKSSGRAASGHAGAAGEAAAVGPEKVGETTSAGASAGRVDRTEFDEETDTTGLELDFAPYDPETLADRHKDDLLQAQATPEALDKSLRRLEELATSTLEESGVNVLYLALGMLHYTESVDSDAVFRAPLIMVPVRLSRRSARSGFLVESNGDDPIVNPALDELLRRQFGASLGDLPAVDAPEAATAVREFFERAAGIAGDRAAAGMRQWAVKTDIVLAVFSFQKLVMFKDLEENADAFGAHRLVHQVVQREGAVGEIVNGLPADVRALELDRDFAPEATAQVVDADSSQLRAIAAVSRGHDLVIEGPPGTGKSQTITNLIAQALADGKSVLFVAEKMAALQVVHSRLVRSGLGEFCLELHAARANKRVVLQEIRQALDSSLQRPVVPKRTHRLPQVRGALSSYAAAVHAPYGALGLSPFRATGMLDAVLDVPRVRLARGIEDLTPETLEDTERLLSELAASQDPIGIPSQHPWQGSRRTFYTPGQIEDVTRALSSAISQLEALIVAARATASELRLAELRTLRDVDAAVAIGRAFAASPGAPVEVLVNPAWNSAPADVARLTEAVRALQKTRNALNARFTEEAFDQDHTADIAYVEQKASGFFGFLAILDGQFRAIKRRWAAYQKVTPVPGVLDQANALRAVDRYRTARQTLEAESTVARALFGALWQGERTSVDALEGYARWVVDVRALCVAHHIQQSALELASVPGPRFATVDGLELAASEARHVLSAFISLVEGPTSWLDDDLAVSLGRVRGMQAVVGQIPSWAAFERVRQEAVKSPAGELVGLAMQGSHAEGDLKFDSLARVFRRAVLEKWLDGVMTDRPELREFSTRSHEQRLAEFRQLDEWVLGENQAAVVAKLRGAAQERLQQSDARAGLPILQQQMARQRNIMPLRKLLHHAEPTIRAIKPCFLMSPLTVAQYLNGRAPSFDLVIFDEASQLPTEDAVGAICRGRQLVVVGDPKQLPPTSFFATTTGTPAPTDDDGLPIVQDSESVLEEFMGAGVPVTRLKWHYRSAHESLIAFSNVSFYDSDLYTFPSVETGGEALGLSFEHVEDGVYEGKGMNTVEARRIADAVVRHAKERPHESLGVGTFNIRQQLAILDELELRRRQDPSLEPFFSRAAAEPFFVKNLENIQGDERDVILLSVTYAKGADGRLRMQFGALNSENGWRRLNVIITRARKRMRVFASLHGDEINAAGTTSRGAHLLREFLLYAEHGRLQSLVANAAARAESPFEAEVVSELSRRGVRCVPQVGVAGYRVDIGVMDPEVPGRFVCGLECDGVAYHSSETARDRDRLRQQVLEARGWIIHRVWSTDWFKDRAGQVTRLLRLIEESRVAVAEQILHEREEVARARRAAEDAQMAAQAQIARDEEQRLGAARTATEKGYERPVVAEYRFANPVGRHSGGDLLAAPLGHLVVELTHIVAAESPVHVDDVRARMAAFWRTRLGSRISARVDDVVAQAVRSGLVLARGPFLWSKEMAAGDHDLVVRTRSGTRITGDRVGPEELAAAIRLVLSRAGGMSPDELLSETRLMLGVSRQSLSTGFDSTVAAAKREGWLGEGSTGLALRST